MTNKHENPNADDAEPQEPFDPNRTNDLRNAVEEALRMGDGTKGDDVDEADDGLAKPPTVPEVGTTTFDLSDHIYEALQMDASQHDEMLAAAEQRASAAMKGDASDAIFTIQHMLRLDLDGGPQSMVVAPSPEMILGRGDKLTDFSPEIDLTEMGAYRLGLSRRHAVITHKQDRLYLRDLNSRNGTSVNGLRLEGQETRILRNGDLIQLGNLQLHVRFIPSP